MAEFIGFSISHPKSYKEDLVPQAIDVGSILGGRYKVTGRILASAEDDIILDGLDQVLNRPVSILVSAVENSGNLTQSAREVATGERMSAVSILDLGTQDGSTYLIASRTSPADLLDLVVPTELADEDVYREPFFTDTLGTEIFGSARDDAPKGGPYVYEDNTPLTPAHQYPAVLPMPATPPPAALPAATAAHAATPAAAVVPPKDAAPKVTLWSEDDYGFINDDHNAATSQGRKGGTFPAEVLAASGDFDPAEDFDEDDENAPRTGGRWLTGIIVAVLVVGALVFAVSHIGSLINGGNLAGDTSPATQSQSQTTAGAETSSVPPVAPVVPPVVVGTTDVTTYVAGAARYGDQFIPRLKDATDGNKGTYWPTVEFSNDSFAGVTDSIDLAIELQAEATIDSVTINQIGGSGGQFNVLTNSAPSLDGATKIGSGSFSAPDFTLKAAPGVKAKYVIISFTQLPKLQPFVTYPYGMKIAEISIK
ncbi:hypothetical protein [Arthrobacter alpinus]|uniref:hypothetical protein n=1 Tax=Arthrobacter alpinus TaxID=656366 RepID=UPI0007802C92|nr:hypothetical protein [Arthrobacter alpinus]